MPKSNDRLRLHMSSLNKQIKNLVSRNGDKRYISVLKSTRDWVKYQMLLNKHKTAAEDAIASRVRRPKTG